MAVPTVTIDKAYFETLLRRLLIIVDKHTSEADITVPTVTINKADYESLLATVRKYENLQRNLYRGGITDDTLEILTQDDVALSYGSFAIMEHETEIESLSTHVQEPVHTKKGTASGTQSIQFQRNINSHALRDSFPPGKNTSLSYSPVDKRVDTLDGPFDGLGGRGPGNCATPAHQQYEKFAKRTIHLINLPPISSHADVVDVVRGGLLLDVYLRLERSNEKTASVSFLHEAQARDFFQYVKRNGLLIRGKKVGIRWSDRQFILPGYVANKISIGATRNLVVHNRDPNETERSIRDDLNHIHNLVIIRVSFKGSDAHISTSSVHNALFARTCMMSRGKYKSCKIEWYPDECAAPFEPRQPIPNSNFVSKKASTIPVNRFQLLDMDGIDDDTQGGAGLDCKADVFDSSFASSFERLD